MPKAIARRPDVREVDRSTGVGIRHPSQLSNVLARLQRDGLAHTPRDRRALNHWRATERGLALVAELPEESMRRASFATVVIGAARLLLGAEDALTGATRLAAGASRLALGARGALAGAALLHAAVVPPAASAAAIHFHRTGGEHA